VLNLRQLGCQFTSHKKDFVMHPSTRLFLNEIIGAVSATLLFVILTGFVSMSFHLGNHSVNGYQNSIAVARHLT
jgi:hypothetical protein